MEISFSRLHKNLRDIAGAFTEVELQKKQSYITQLSRKALPGDKKLIEYCDLLLFLAAYPSSEDLLTLVEEELARIEQFMQRPANRYKEVFENSGLPFSETATRFSHDLLVWLNARKEFITSIYSFDESTLKLAEVLRLTLPSLEKETVLAEMEHEEAFEALQLKVKSQLPFLLGELSKLDSTPWIKDQLFDALNCFVTVRPLSASFSRPRNHFRKHAVFFHADILKKFDHVALLNTPLPEAKSLSEAEKNELITVIRDSLALLGRETDPSTWLMAESLRLYELERGISIAIYGMTPDRQLPLESYMGFTLFKNGFPAAYGGAWVFGRRALFGMNVFEYFRGGESGYIMSQLLRTYRQAFGVDYIEVESYQFGKDNPDGIASGAFWFYYRYGFRPLDKALLVLSEKESKKIREKKGYRSSVSILEKFTESNMALNMGKGVPPAVSDITPLVTKMIQRQHEGDRRHAVKASVQKLLARLGVPVSVFNKDERQALEETALMLEAWKGFDNVAPELLIRLIRSKPYDPYAYQLHLLEVFEGK